MLIHYKLDILKNKMALGGVVLVRRWTQSGAYDGKPNGQFIYDRSLDPVFLQQEKQQES